MGIELDTTKAVCCKCGRAYGKRKSNFPSSYGTMYKGTGFLPVCKDCVDSMYRVYLTQCNDSAAAVRQVCRSLNLYWNQKAFDASNAKTSARTIMSGYITKLNTVTYSGKCYDDTLIEEDSLWVFDKNAPSEDIEQMDDTSTEVYKISNRVREYWGSNYDDKDYYDLERRKKYWLSGFPKGTKIDVATERYIKQICELERDIERARAAGKSVDKLVASFDKLVGSLGIKPAQKQEDDAESDLADTPMGVWLYRYENDRPLPQIDDDLKDVNGLLKYIFIWIGHVCKMLGKKNGFARLYEAEIERLRVEQHDSSDEDSEYETDEDVLMDYFGVGKEQGEDASDGDSS
jgi:hypothetical protein